MRERDERADDGLTPADARDGAETLAAACILAQETNIRVPDDRDAKGDGLVAADWLPADWPAARVRALLQRGVFDGAAYGRIRFHHRRITEYLAAAWLARRIADGRDLPSMEDLLFSWDDQGAVLRPSLEPVAAWLILGGEGWRVELRGRVLEVAPWVIVQHGDPSDFPLADKRRALHAWAGCYRAGKLGWYPPDVETLARIAEPGLAPTVNALLADADLSDDFRVPLLWLVGIGRITDCVDTALALVAATTAGEWVRRHAIEAVGMAGSPMHKARLYADLMALPALPFRLCEEACIALFPEAIDISDLVTLLERVDDVPPPGSTTGVYQLSQHLQGSIERYDSAALLVELSRLLLSAPGIEGNEESRPCSARFYWLAEPLAEVLMALLRRDIMPLALAEPVAMALDALARCSQFPGVFLHISIDDLRQRLVHHSQVRRAYVWQRVRDQRAQEPHPSPSLYVLFGYQPLLDVDQSDFDWLVDDIRRQASEEDRQIALDLAIQYWSMLRRTRRGRQALRQATKGNPALRQSLRDSKELRVWFPLTRWVWRQRHQGILARWYWQRRWHSLKQHIREAWSVVWLHGHLRSIRNGRNIWLLHQLAQIARHRSTHASWAANDWSVLKQRYGPLIAGAARQGCIAAWPGYAPILPFDRADGGVDRYLIVGLSGLAALWSEGRLNFATLAHEQAVIAARYALSDMNGPPDWFPSLVDHHPELVTDLLAAQIALEWQIPEDRTAVYTRTRSLSRHAEYLVPLLSDSLSARIEIKDPPNAHVLAQALAILTAQVPNARARLASLAPSRIAAAEDASAHRKR